MDDKEKQPSPEANEKFTEAELNNHLNDLALEAQRHPLESRDRQLALTRLVSQLRKPSRLSLPKHSPSLSLTENHQVSEDIKQETDLALFEFIQKGKFDPKKGNVLNYARFTQSKKQIDFIASHQGIHQRTEKGKKVTDIVLSADRQISNAQSADGDESQTTYLDQFTSDIPEPSFLEKMRETALENPENIFSKPMRIHPDIALQEIFLLWLDGYTWQEISDKLSAKIGLDVKIGSISSFFNRAIKDEKLIAVVKLYLAQFLFVVAILLNFGDTH
ncbi:hypothetical protein [Microcoleus sp. EPA2]|uniref:hypothetical protein n=1 Tax=Microcoleus sp. EPA2 TaxID=2841654 RepID=UPI00312BC93B